MKDDELIDKVIEWLFDNTREYEFEYWGGAQEEGVKFYDFKTKDEMIDSLRNHIKNNK